MALIEMQFVIFDSKISIDEKLLNGHTRWRRYISKGPNDI